MTDLDERRRLKRRRSRVRGFQPGVRVMGEPGQFGKVIAHTPDGLAVRVWWDGGREETKTPTHLSIVKKERT